MTRPLTIGVLAACLALVQSPVARASDVIDYAVPYVVDFFPEGLQRNNVVQLLFFGPGKLPNAAVGSWVRDVRLVVEFTTANGFDAADLRLILLANSGTTSVVVTGADLGWSGEGTFGADMHFDGLNGRIGEGLWVFDIVGDTPEGTYSGTFGAVTRWEVTLAAEGDLNDDLIVNGADLGLLLGAWGTDDPIADLDQDGVVDGADLGLLLGAWGPVC